MQKGVTGQFSYGGRFCLRNIVKRDRCVSIHDAVKVRSSVAAQYP